jgi:hypothetical protein
MTGEANCPRCAQLGSTCPKHRSLAALADQQAFMAEHFQSSSAWPQGEAAAKMAELNLTLAAQHDGLADEVLALHPGDTELAESMRETAEMFRRWALLFGAAPGGN